jgi:hypothetical protein
MWTDIYENSGNGMEREVAWVYLARIEMEETIDRLQAAAQRYKKQQGAWPSSMGDLVKSGLVESIPAEDPFKGRYYWSADSNKVKSTSQKKFLK